MSVEQAAAAVRKTVNGIMSSAIAKEVLLRGYSPDEFLIYAYGGGGPTHVSDYMGDIPKAIIFPYSPVFSAMGERLMDITHIYERSNRMFLLEPSTKKVVIDFSSFNKTVEDLMSIAKVHLQEEGIPLDRVTFSLELDMLYGGQINVKRCLAPKLFINSEEDALELYNAFEKEFSDAFSPLAVNVEGGVIIDNFVIRGIYPIEKGSLPTYELEKPSADHARKGTREVFWDEKKGFFETPLYDYEALRPGNLIEGPAIVEGPDSTVVIRPGMTYSVDKHGLGILKREG